MQVPTLFLEIPEPRPQRPVLGQLKDITVTVGDQLTVNLTLRVGTVSEKVEVASLAGPIDLASLALGNQVDSITVRELPLNGRDSSRLTTLESGP